MKLINFTQLLGALILFSQCVFANPYNAISCLNQEIQEEEQQVANAILDQQTFWGGKSKRKGWNSNKSHSSCSQCCKFTLPLCCHVGISTFFKLPLQPYLVETNRFPILTLFSKEGNLGVAQGGVKPKPTGILITEPGNYWFSFQAIFRNRESDAMNVGVVLVKNGAIDPNDPNAFIGNLVRAPDNTNIVSENASGLFLNLEPGTLVELVAINTDPAQDQPETIEVLYWTINCFKIPCIQSTTHVIPEPLVD